jgi:hypothetical protein
MTAKESATPDVHTLLTGIAFGESPRWHDDRLWFADWGAQQVVAVDLEGNHEVVAQVSFPSFPMCIDWLPDGPLLIVSARDGLVLRREPDGSLVPHADLSGLAGPGHPWNEIVVDGRGNAYVNNQGFEFPGGQFAPGTIALLTPDGSARLVADGIAFPNGMAVTSDNRRLIVAESYATSSPRSTSPTTAACRRGGSGPSWMVACPTASASTPRTPSGTPTCPTSVACAFARVARCWRRSTLTAAASRACSGAPTGAPCSWWRPSGVAPSTWPRGHQRGRC